MWRRGTPHALLVGMQIGATMENSMAVPQKIKNRATSPCLGDSLGWSIIPNTKRLQMRFQVREHT